MTRMKTIPVGLLLIGAGAFGLTLAAAQSGPGRPTKPDGKHRPVSAKSKAPPPIRLMSEYVVEPPDLLLVEVLEALPGRPISGERLVRPDGKIHLGFYGEVYVAGLTLSQIKEKIVNHLRQHIPDEQLGLMFIDEETGENVVDPNTGKPKRVDPKDSDRVFVDVTAYNSKNYYVEGEVAVLGRIPVTGQERILDAISFAGGLTPFADHEQVFLYREGAKGEPVKTFKIDIDQILLGDDLSTNYQVLPGDKLVVRRREVLAREKGDAPRRTTVAPRSNSEVARFNRKADVNADKLAEFAPKQNAGIAPSAALQSAGEANERNGAQARPDPRDPEQLGALIEDRPDPTSEAFFSGTAFMSKLNAITLCIAFIGTATAGLTPAPSQDVGTGRGGNQRAKNAAAQKTRTPPPFTQTADYIVEPPDLINVEVQDALPGRPVSGRRLVRPDGKISLGFYGEVFVAGLTVPEIKVKVIDHLRLFIRDEVLGLVALDDVGQPLLDPATGKPKRIDAKESNQVSVELAQCNSKFYYVEGEVLTPGRFPVTGTESVMDAIRKAGGPSRLCRYRKSGALQRGISRFPGELHGRPGSGREWKASVNQLSDQAGRPIGRSPPRGKSSRRRHDRTESISIPRTRDSASTRNANG